MLKTLLLTLLLEVQRQLLPALLLEQEHQVAQQLFLHSIMYLFRRPRARATRAAFLVLKRETGLRRLGRERPFQNHKNLGVGLHVCDLML